MIGAMQSAEIAIGATTLVITRIAYALLFSLTAIVSASIAQDLSAQTPLADSSRETVGLFTYTVARQQDAKSSPKAIDVYLFGGQSNMQGIGKIAELPQTISREIPYTYFWNKRNFELLVMGTTKVSTRISEFGPEIGFGLQMATAERPVYIVKYHASGMPLHHGWDRNTWVGGDAAPKRRNFYPGKNSDDLNTGTLYASMRSEFRAAVKHLSDAGFTPVVRGFLWMQGEQDSKNEVSASTYAANLNQLRRRLAEDMQVNKDMPLVFGQVLPYDPPMERFTHRNEIRAQMAACDSESGKPETMKNTVMVSTDGFSIGSDTVHYDAAGQLELGRAFGNAMKKLVLATSR